MEDDTDVNKVTFEMTEKEKDNSVKDIRLEALINEVQHSGLELIKTCRAISLSSMHLDI